MSGVGTVFACVAFHFVCWCAVAELFSAILNENNKLKVENIVANLKELILQLLTICMIRLCLNICTKRLHSYGCDEKVAR